MESRRSVICGKIVEGYCGIVPILLLLILVCIIPFSSSAQSAPLRQLTLIHPEDPDFDTLLNTNFPGLERLDGYSAFRPYLVLMRNDASQSARAYAVEWETRSSNGMIHRSVSHFIQKRNPAVTIDRQAFTPGELRLISPTFDVSPVEYTRQQNSIANLMSALSTHPPYSFVNTQSITASVDAAVFADGAYIGPDRNRLLLRYQCKRDAERDVAQALLQLLDAKAPVGDVLALLEHDAQAGRAANTSQADRDSVYALYRGREAQTFLTLYHRGGIESVMTRAWAVAQNPQEKIIPQ
jgi:hypothetical protein